MLVTTALPYANGDIHIGHILEHIQADIWCRFHRMQGIDCRFFCADDTHGTPIMVSAQAQNITPEELIAKSYDNHYRDLTGFLVEYDNYYTTNSEENKQLIYEIYEALKNKNHIETKTIQQAYCEHDKMFLPDRFVKGTCPKCGAKEQFGDACEVCSHTYSTAELKDSYCTLCKNPPTQKQSEHLFFKLGDFQDFLKAWVKDHTQSEISNKLNEWLDQDLKSWDISRDKPYFGFEIPGYKEKYFYVWVDAPVGYMASTLNWCNKNNQNFADWWKNKDTKIYHFIGKDIVYFHTLFWPAMLEASGFNTPEKVFVHGFVKVNGEKMSKSKGTFINAKTFLNHLSPEYLRYYYASKLSLNVDDLDLNLNDFMSRVNSELVGKITNLASRGAQMLGKRLDGIVVPLKSEEAKELVKMAQSKSEIIAKAYTDLNFHKALTEIRTIADEANKYFDQKQPWNLIKEDPESTKEVLSAIINVFRIITIYLKPVLPSYALQVEKLFNDKPYTWDDTKHLLENKKINEYTHLMGRIDKKAIDAMIEEEKSQTKEKPKKTESFIEIDDFLKVDLRVGLVESVEPVEGADKLLKLIIDLGPMGKKQVFAGIKSNYSEETLKGKLVATVVNLKPRKMKFGVSEAMVLAGSGKKGGPRVLLPDGELKPGDKIK